MLKNLSEIFRMSPVSLGGASALMWALFANAMPPSLPNLGTGQEGFPTGVYIYAKGSAASPWNYVEMNSHLRYLASQGINTIHITSAALPFADRTDKTVLDVAKKYGIKVVVLVGTAYYPMGSASVAQTYINALRQTDAGDSLLAFSVKEEACSGTYTGPCSAYVSGLFGYYLSIQGGSAPSIPFYLVHNTDTAFKYVYDNYANPSNAISPVLPVITGTENYPFGWTFCSDIGYVTTPKKGLTWFTSAGYSHSVPYFLPYASLDNQRVYSVITSNTERATYPVTTLDTLCTNGAQKRSRWMALAQASNQGLMLDSSGDNILSWRYYRPPVGVMSAQAWLSVAGGAQGVMAWSASPDSAVIHQTGNMPSSDNRGLFDALGTPHRSFAELAQVARDLKPFGRIINEMRRAPNDDTSIIVGVPLHNTLVNEIITSAFSVTGVSGRVVVLVNSHVGAWAEDTSREFLLQADSYHIDQFGEVISGDFTPAAPLVVDLTPPGGSQIFDFTTGLPLADSNSNSLGDVEVPAGRGRLLYAGTQADFDILRNHAGLSKLFPVTGNASLSAEQLAKIDTRLVIPANPWVFGASDGDVVETHALDANKRYQLDLVIEQASALNFDVASYDSYNNLTSIQAIPGSLSGAQTVSKEFVTGSAAVQKLRIHRGSGPLTIRDAWLKDRTNENRLTGYYVTKILLDPSKTYAGQVVVRELPGETSTLGVRWYNCLDSACSTLSPSNGINVVPWGTALTDEAKSVSFNAFKSQDPLAQKVMLVIYRANYGAVPGQTMVIERASVWATD